MDEKEMLDFGSYLANTKGLADKTLTLYLSYFRQIDLTYLDQQEYVNAFVQAHGNNPVIRGMMLNLLRYKGLHKLIELPETTSGRTKKRLIRAISQEEINKFRKYLYALSFKKGLIFDLMYQGAMRRDEITTIRINSFHWIEWMEHPEQFCNLSIIGKGDKERTVLINPETVQSILDYYVQNKPNLDFISFVNSDQFLFLNDNGDPITEKVVYYIIKRGSKRCLGRDIRPHEMRHQRSQELYKRGVNIMDIKNYLGHSSVATTEIYLHRSQKESLENIQSIMKMKEKEDIA